MLNLATLLRRKGLPVPGLPVSPRQVPCLVPFTWTYTLTISPSHMSLPAHLPAKDTTSKEVEESSFLKVYSRCVKSSQSGFPRKVTQAPPSCQPCMKRKTRKGQPDSRSLSSRTFSLYSQIVTTMRCGPTDDLRHGSSTSAPDISIPGVERWQIISTEPQGSLFLDLCQFSHNNGVQVKLMCSQEV